MKAIRVRVPDNSETFSRLRAVNIDEESARRMLGQVFTVQPDIDASGLWFTIISPRVFDGWFMSAYNLPSTAVQLVNEPEEAQSWHVSYTT